MGKVSVHTGGGGGGEMPFVVGTYANTFVDVGFPPSAVIFGSSTGFSGTETVSLLATRNSYYFNGAKILQFQNNGFSFFLGQYSGTVSYIAFR